MDKAKKKAREQEKTLRHLIPEFIETERLNKIRAEARISFRQSDEYKADSVRRKSLQNLDKANKAGNANKLENMKVFFKEFVANLIQNFNELAKNPPITQGKLNKFAASYSAHIDVLKRFDAEHELDASKGYDSKFIDALNAFLEKRIPVLAKTFNLKESKKENELEPKGEI